MEKWVIRICRALMMGLGWGAAWVPIGVFVASLFVAELDPPHIGGPLYVGFTCGVIFSAVAGLASGRRRLDELSFSRAAASGAVAGAAIPLILFAVGDGSFEEGPWQAWAAFVSVAILASTVSALGTVFLARSAKTPATRFQAD